MYKTRTAAKSNTSERIKKVQQHRLSDFNYTSEKVDFRHDGDKNADAHAHYLRNGDFACGLVPERLHRLYDCLNKECQDD